MTNNAKIEGNDNVLIQDSKKSQINIKTSPIIKKSKFNYQLLKLIIAIVTLIVSIIIGWDYIIKFFKP
jgi:hypothetical protein